MSLIVIALGRAAPGRELWAAMTDWSELARESESHLSSLAKGQSVRGGSVRTGHGDLRRAAIDMRTCGRKRPVTRWFCTGPRGAAEAFQAE